MDDARVMTAPGNCFALAVWFSVIVFWRVKKKVKAPFVAFQFLYKSR
jgi:hypothetical protein